MVWTADVGGASAGTGNVPTPGPGDEGKTLKVTGGVAVWETNAGNDANYREAFTNVAALTFNHNLGKRPAITVEDSTGEVRAVEIDHVDDNTATLTFGGPMSGIAYAN